MPDELALPSLILVAYTMECDNVFEHELPHRTAAQGRGAGSGPWLTSMPMWANFLRYLPAGGATRAELEPLSRMVNLGGLLRWGYLRVEPRAPSLPRADPGPAGRSVGRAAASSDGAASGGYPDGS